MSDLIVEEWRKWGMNRLYVDRPDGPRVGFMDLDTGDINADNPDNMDEMVDRIERWKAQNPDAVARWGLSRARDVRRPAVATWGVRSAGDRTPAGTTGTAVANGATAGSGAHDVTSCACGRLKMTYWTGDGEPKLMIRNSDRILIGHWDLASNDAHPKNPADHAIIEHAYEIWRTRHAVAASAVTGEAGVHTEVGASGQGAAVGMQPASGRGTEPGAWAGAAAWESVADGAKRTRGWRLGARIRSLFRRRSDPAP